MNVTKFVITGEKRLKFNNHKSYTMQLVLTTHTNSMQLTLWHYVPLILVLMPPLICNLQNVYLETRTMSDTISNGWAKVVK